MSDAQPNNTTATAPPLRVLTVVTFYRPHWTGLTRFAQRIAEVLADAGHHVTVLTSRYDPDLPPNEELDGVEVRRLAVAGRLSRTVVMPGFPAALWREVGRHDVVHLHSPMAEAGLVALACRLTGTPLVITHQGDVVMPDGVVNQLVQRGMVAMLGATFRRADRVVTHNHDYLRHSLTAVAGERATAIEPPVPFAPAQPGAAAAFRELHQLGTDPVIGFAGRWVEEKGFDVLMRAAPLVLADVPGARFVFAGERQVAYEQFAERCQHLVDSLGEAFTDVGLLVDEADLAAFYAASDVFVLPSRTDCHASVQVEAMLCGTPVVASDIPGARSVVQRTGAGRLVPPEDPAALAAALVDVLAAPGRYDPELAEVPELYDPGLAGKEYTALIETVGRPVGPESPGPATAGQDELRGPGHELVAGDLDTAYRRRMLWVLDRLDHLGLGSGDRVLDAGCGLGNVSAVLEVAFPDADLVAVDLDADRLAAGRSNGVSAPLARAEIGRLPFPDASIDAVVCSEVLEHVVHPEAAVAELHRVMRPGARLLVTVPHADHPWTWDPINRALTGLGRRPVRSGLFAGAWTDHRRLYRAAELDELLRGAGFAIDEIEEQTSTTVPFAHFLFYGLGRLAVDHGLVSTDQAGGRPSPRSVRAVVDRVDRRSLTRSAGATRFVSLVASASRPV